MMLTLIEGERRHAIGAQFAEGRIQVDPADVEDALGWKLTREGLCRGSVCVPVRDRASLVRAGGLDLEALAALLARSRSMPPSASPRSARARAIAPPRSTRSMPPTSRCPISQAGCMRSPTTVARRCC
jgi:hypothetical protein